MPESKVEELNTGEIIALMSSTETLLGQLTTGLQHFTIDNSSRPSCSFAIRAIGGLGRAQVTVYSDLSIVMLDYSLSFGELARPHGSERVVQWLNRIGIEQGEVLVAPAAAAVVLVHDSSTMEQLRVKLTQDGYASVFYKICYSPMCLRTYRAECG